MLGTDVTVGFSGYLGSDSWAPVSVRLRNDGPRVEGTLMVASTLGNVLTPQRSLSVVTRNIALNTGERKEYSFLLPVETTGRPLKVEINDLHGNPLSTTTIDVSRRRLSSPLVVATSRTSELDFLISGGGNAADQRFTPAYVFPEQLPQRWMGYDGVGTVFLGDTDVTRITSAQVHALSVWVQSGGTLVIRGGTHLGAHRADALSALLPGRYLGTALLDAFQRTPVSILDPAGQAHVMAETADTALVIEEPRGHGRVVFVATSLRTIANLKVMSEFELAAFFTASANAPNRLHLDLVTQRNPARDPLLSTLADIPVYRFPSRLSVIAAGALYCALFLVLLHAASRRKNGGYTRHIAFLLLPVIASGAVLILFNVMRKPPDSMLVQLEVLRVEAGYKSGVLSSDLFAFSTARRNIAVSVPQEAVPVTFKGGQLERKDVDAGEELPFHLERWQMAHFYQQSIADTPLTSTVRREGKRSVLELRNDSSAVLEDLHIIAHGEMRFLGALGPDEMTRIAWDDPLQAGSPPNAEIGRARRALLGGLLDEQSLERRTGRPIRFWVVGWAASPWQEITVTPAAERLERRSLFIIEVLAPEETYARQP